MPPRCACVVRRCSSLPHLTTMLALVQLTTAYQLSACRQLALGSQRSTLPRLFFGRKDEDSGTDDDEAVTDKSLQAKKLRLKAELAELEARELELEARTISSSSSPGTASPLPLASPLPHRARCRSAISWPKSAAPAWVISSLRCRRPCSRHGAKDGRCSGRRLSCSSVRWTPR